MRRKDREVTGEAIREIIDNCVVARLGLVGEGRAYIVPMNFGYRLEGGALTLYFHSAREGRKIDLIRKNPIAAFEMDGKHALRPGEEACEYSYEYGSVMGEGRVKIVEDEDEKRDALDAIMLRQTGRAGFSYPSEQVARVMILRLDADWYTAKRSGR